MRFFVERVLPRLALEYLVCVIELLFVAKSGELVRNNNVAISSAPLPLFFFHLRLTGTLQEVLGTLPTYYKGCKGARVFVYGASSRPDRDRKTKKGHSLLLKTRQPRQDSRPCVNRLALGSSSPGPATRVKPWPISIVARPRK